ncbi:hypothetical protein [Streptomyces sp. S465]|uniref:hypothetical protein n=1 Tax=Streptomyces sp. S465 TaxID=2979468 RepID=UPI0022A8AF83|nr:hypothetical protein [Streptomyces sp. S465]WAP53489.1 hypothetical protein N6H00_00120 [Streptomyces sp. S465]
MTGSTFYSDRVGQGRPRVSEIITTEAWAGITVLIQQRINDGSLARAFPRYDCPDDRGRNTITGTDEEKFLHALKAHVPKLVEPPAPPDEGQDTESDEIFFGRPSPRAHTQAQTGAPLDPDKAPDTATALDVVDFVALHVGQPSYSKPHSWCFEHTDYSFDAQRADLHFDGGLKPVQEQFQRGVDLLFARNGIAFAIGDDMCVRRLGPPEARPLVSDFRPGTGDPQLDDKLNDAIARSCPGTRSTGGTLLRSSGTPSSGSRLSNSAGTRRRHLRNSFWSVLSLAPNRSASFWRPSSGH